MEENGFAVKTESIKKLTAIRTKYPVPPDLRSCHTAIVDGYVIEGHVPVAEIERLLSERPDVIGLAVRGMPIGSPGMESDTTAPESFDVIAFDRFGKKSVFASYPK